MIRRFIRLTALAVAVAALAIAAGLAKPAPASAATNVNWYDPVDAVNAFIPSIDSYWRAVFANYHKAYFSPRGYYWYGYTDSNGNHIVADCGSSQLPDMNAVYCQSDHNIYLGYGYLQQKINTYGPYAAIGTLAHEWGHHVQALLGWWSYAQQHHYYMGTELQADCYAGMYTRWAFDHGWISAANVRDAQNGRFAVGDDIVAKGESLDPYTPGAHGTGAQRLAWFNYGFNTQNLLSCNRVYQVIYGS
jgi:predicted metalloprotease